MIDFMYRFLDDWSTGLSFYRTIGIFFQKYLHRGVFLEANFNGSMQKPLTSMISSWLFFALALFTLIFIVDCLIAYYKNEKLKTKLIFASLVLLAFFFAGGLTQIFPKIAVAKLMLVTAPYLILGLCLLYVTHQIITATPSDSRTSNKTLVNPYLFLVLMIATVFAFQFLKLGPAIRIPALFIPYDILLWGILGLYLFAYSRIEIKLLYQLLFVLMLACVYEAPVSNLLTIKSPAPVEVLPSLSSSVERSDYLDTKSGLCKFDYEDQTKTIVYAAILGCDLKYSAQRTASLSLNFLAKEK